MKTRPIKVLKFGGTSVGSAEALLRAVRPEHPEAHRRLQELGHSLRVDQGWAIVALVGEGLRSRPGEALSLMASEPVVGVFAGGAGISVAFLVPEARLAALIPELHGACFGAR
jgi:aspartokinase